MRNSVSADSSEDVMAESSVKENENRWPAGVFRMPRGKFFMNMTRLYGRPWIIGMIASFIAGAILWICTADIRWFIVMLMLIFIVFPMLAAFLYFSHGLRPESFFNIVPHRLEEGEDGLTAVLYREKKSDDTHDKESTDEEGSVIELEECGRIPLPYHDMRAYYVGSESIIIPVGKGLIWISREAFGEKREMENFMMRISEKMRQ